MKFVFPTDRLRGVNETVLIDSPIGIGSLKRAISNRQSFRANTSTIAQVVAKCPKIGLVPENVPGLCASQLHNLTIELERVCARASDEYRHK